MKYDLQVLGDVSRGEVVGSFGHLEGGKNKCDSLWYKVNPYVI